MSRVKKSDALRRNFFWGRDGEHKKIQCFNRDLAQKSTVDGGLRITSLDIQNLALLGKNVANSLKVKPLGHY